VTRLPSPAQPDGDGPLAVATSITTTEEPTMSHLAPTPLVRTLCVAALAALSLPALAVGARCPAGSAVLEVTSQFQGGVLRCIARGQATPACPPSHPVYRIMPEQTGQPAADFCAPPNLIVPAPSQRASVQCPSGMNVVINGGNGNRDLCRAGGTTQVPPTIIPN
jgi:hypothetical protein